jgi:hypothetical protein
MNDYILSIVLILSRIMEEEMLKKLALLACIFALAAGCGAGSAEATRQNDPKEVKTHEPVILRGYDGAELTMNSKEPYSPRQTCGACHDYDKITNGFHFQQGRTDGSGKIVISDSFNPKKPWHKSAGMYGKW